MTVTRAIAGIVFVTIWGSFLAAPIPAAPILAAPILAAPILAAPSALAEAHQHGADAHDAHEADAHHAHASAGNLGDYVADLRFTLQTGTFDGQLGFLGVGGDINGVVNPTLHVPHGAVVEILLINGDGLEHDITFPDFEAVSEHTSAQGEQAVLAFQAHHVAPGAYTYFCGLPGHRLAGQEGAIVVSGS